MKKDILEPVPDSEIPQILYLLKKDWPQHILLHEMITILSQYREGKVKVSQALYRYGHIDGGVYLVKTTFHLAHDLDENRQAHTHVLLYTTSQNLQDMAEVLAETSRIPWGSHHLIFENILARFSAVIQQAATLRGHKLVAKSHFDLLVAPENELDLRDVSEEVVLRYLNKTDMTEIDRQWPHRFPGSEEFLNLHIRNNFGIGLFRQSDGTRACSALSMHYGGISVLYTNPEDRGRGYAEVIVRTMVRELSDRGRHAFATILPENTPSLKLFKKIGFEHTDQVNFLFFDSGLLPPSRI